MTGATKIEEATLREKWPRAGEDNMIHLVHVVKAHPLVVLVGARGSGKSTLLSETCEPANTTGFLGSNSPENLRLFSDHHIKPIILETLTQPIRFLNQLYNCEIVFDDCRGYEIRPSFKKYIQSGFLTLLRSHRLRVGYIYHAGSEIPKILLVDNDALLIIKAAAGFLSRKLANYFNPEAKNLSRAAAKLANEIEKHQTLILFKNGGYAILQDISDIDEPLEVKHLIPLKEQREPKTDYVKIAELYVGQEKSPLSIKEALEISLSTVYRALKAKGVELRDSGGEKKKPQDLGREKKEAYRDLCKYDISPILSTPAEHITIHSPKSNLSELVLEHLQRFDWPAYELEEIRSRLNEISRTNYFLDTHRRCYGTLVEVLFKSRSENARKGFIFVQLLAESLIELLEESMSPWFLLHNEVFKGTPDLALFRPYCLPLELEEKNWNGRVYRSSFIGKKRAEELVLKRFTREGTRRVLLTAGIEPSPKATRLLAAHNIGALKLLDTQVLMPSIRIRKIVRRKLRILLQTPPPPKTINCRINAILREEGAQDTPKGGE